MDLLSSLRGTGIRPNVILSFSLLVSIVASVTLLVVTSQRPDFERLARRLPVPLDGRAYAWISENDLLLYEEYGTPPNLWRSNMATGFTSRLNFLSTYASSGDPRHTVID